MTPRIVKPLDWQEVTGTELDVVLEGAPDDRLGCVLWPRDAFFALPRQACPVLARAAVRPVAPGLAHARLTGLHSWGDCVIGIVALADDTAIALCGARLGSEPTRGWMRDRLPDSQEAPAILPLVPVVSCALSHIPADTAEPVAHATDLAALLARDAAVSVLPLLAPDTLDAHAVLDDSLCLGPVADRGAHLLAQSPYAASEPYLAAMRDVTVILPGGVVMPGGDRIWSDSTHAAFWLDPDFRQYPALFRTEAGIGMIRDATLTEADLLADNERDALPGVPLLAFGNAWRNHGHWLMNTVFAAFLLRDAIAAGQVCVLVPQLSDYVFDTLRAAGVPRRAILVARPGTYRFAQALFPSTLSIDANRFPPRAMGDMFRFMVERGPRPGTASMAAPGAERVYVTRLGSPTQRWISNEAALIEALRARGFACVAPHELTVEEEIRAFSGARVIVGQLGAGLLNVGFAPAGCRVVEIASHNYTANDVWFLCGVLGHRFSRLLVPGRTEEAMTVTAFDFELPLAPALALIDHVLERL